MADQDFEKIVEEKLKGKFARQQSAAITQSAPPATAVSIFSIEGLKNAFHELADRGQNRAKQHIEEQDQRRKEVSEYRQRNDATGRLLTALDNYSKMAIIPEGMIMEYGAPFIWDEKKKALVHNSRPFPSVKDPRSLYPYQFFHYLKTSVIVMPLSVPVRAKGANSSLDHQSVNLIFLKNNNNADALFDVVQGTFTQGEETVFSDRKASEKVKVQYIVISEKLLKDATSEMVIEQHKDAMAEIVAQSHFEQGLRPKDHG